MTNFNRELNLNDINSINVIEIDGIIFYKNELEAIEKNICHGVTGDIYVNSVEFTNSDITTPIYFYTMKISIDRPVAIKTSTGCNGSWNKVINPKFFNSYFSNKSNACTFEIADAKVW